MLKFHAYDLNVTVPGKVSFTAKEFFVTYLLKRLLYKQPLSFDVKVVDGHMKSEQPFFLGMNDLRIGQLVMSFYGQSDATLAQIMGQGNVSIDRLNGEGQDTLLKHIGEILRVRSLELMTIEKMAFKVEIEGVKLVMTDIISSSEDYTLSGSGEYLFEDHLNYICQLNYRPFVPGSTSGQENWEDLKIKISGILREPHITIKG